MPRTALATTSICVLCEDLGAEPLFCINVGMSHKENVPMDRMGQWVQDALDAIEYANGPTNSVWGARRAASGHPAPFNLKYMEIGNENGGPAYRERWPLFVKAIKDKYPYMQLIANHWAGGYPKTPAAGHRGRALLRNAGVVHAARDTVR